MADESTPVVNGVPNKSMAVWGSALFAAVTALEGTGAVPPGTGMAIAAVVKAIGILVAAIGFRRRLPMQ
jgi:hypothetical protein